LASPPPRKAFSVLQTVPRQKLRDVVVERLKTFITSGGLKPGDRLPNETELATQFGVSRLSLREATKALELFGIVESKTGVGLTVGQVNLERITGHLGFHPALQNGSPRQLIDTRVVIEIGALPYTAQRMAEDPGIYTRLRELSDRFRGTRELQDWIDLDIVFHRSLLDASGLLPLVAFNDLLQIFFQKFRESVKKAEWRQGIEGHQRILDALRDQDVPRASDELRKHIESHKHRMGVS
jgi:GntR family transcriptional repressor for pyruvate dehydrogenase complex